MSFLPLDSAISNLIASRELVQRQLEATPEYQAVKAIDDAIAALRKVPSVGLVGAVGPRGPLGPSSGVFSHIFASNLISNSRISQSLAAQFVLKREGPMTIADLLPKVRNEGAHVSGSDPLVNLSSSLSRDDRFRSFRKDGAHFWALKEVQEDGGSTGAVTPAAVDNQSQKGGDGQ